MRPVPIAPHTAEEDLHEAGDPLSRGIIRRLPLADRVEDVVTDERRLRSAALNERHQITSHISTAQSLDKITEHEDLVHEVRMLLREDGGVPGLHAQPQHARLQHVPGQLNRWPPGRCDAIQPQRE